MHPTTISPSAIVPLAIELFDYDSATWPMMQDNCVTCNNPLLNNCSTRNQTHDLGSDINSCIERLPLGQNLYL